MEIKQLSNSAFDPFAKEEQNERNKKIQKEFTKDNYITCIVITIDACFCCAI